MRQAFLYIFLGIVFTAIAFNHAQNAGTIWNFLTILITLIAAIDFGMGIRYLRLHIRKKQQEK